MAPTPAAAATVSSRGDTSPAPPGGSQPVAGGWQLAAASALTRLLRQRELGIALVAIILFVLFSLLSHGTFDSVQNWAAIGSATAELGIVTVGVSLLMVSGEFDLSVGANFAFAALVMALMIHDGYPPLEALGADIGIGIGVGLLNGLVTVMLDIPSFITTLGTFFLWSGVTLLVTGGQTVTILNPPGVLTALGGSVSGQIRAEIFWWLGAGLVIGLLLHRTVTGNWLFAVGGKRFAARETGVPVVRTRVIAFVICGVLAAFAGAVQLGHLDSMSASFGSTYQLEAIAASVVGGCALTGGRGSILGAMIGTVVLQMLDNGLILSGVSPYWYESVVGVIVIAAVALHVRIGRLTRGAEQ